MRIVLFMTLALSSAALSAACSDDESGSGSGGATSSSTTASTTSTSTTSTGGDGGGGPGGGGPGGGGPGGGAPGCGTGDATLTEVQAILTQRCATGSCHGNASTPSAQLDLRAGETHGELVDVDSLLCSAQQRVLVVAGDPDASYLLDKVKGDDTCGSQRMPPPPGNALSNDEIQTITNWICAGAPNN
jgi:hypothetical protein